VVDRNGYVWCTIDGTGQGLIVFDGRAALEGTSTNTYRTFSSANTELTDNKVISLAVDLEGDVWIGTFNGVVVADCGANVFDPESCSLSKRVIEENDFDDENEHLLKGEVVTAIAIDGANRKWFGTTNGVFVQSASGKEQIASFNSENSPLFDNSIIDIGINDENGEVFIGTDKGVISYRSEAIKGGTVNSSEVYAFPNPVRPDYQGPIAVKGLAQNANVKITDVNGQLVYETTALGGQAIWDGTDYNGRRANSGVYLVFSTSDSLEFPDAIVTKILFIN